jgi:hypothetical protein
MPGTISATKPSEMPKPEAISAAATTGRTLTPRKATSAKRGRRPSAIVTTACMCRAEISGVISAHLISCSNTETPSFTCQ